MLIDYEIRDFSLKIMLLNQKFWFNSFLKTPKNLPLGGRFFVMKKSFFLIEKNNDSTVNPSAFNYCHQSKI